MIIGYKDPSRCGMRDEYIVRLIPVSKVSTLCGVEADWIMISEDATEEQVAALYPCLAWPIKKGEIA